MFLLDSYIPLAIINPFEVLGLSYELSCLSNLFLPLLHTHHNDFRLVNFPGTTQQQNRRFISISDSHSH